MQDCNSSKFTARFEKLNRRHQQARKQSFCLQEWDSCLRRESWWVYFLAKFEYAWFTKVLDFKQIIISFMLITLWQGVKRTLDSLENDKVRRLKGVTNYNWTPLSPSVTSGLLWLGTLLTIVFQWIGSNKLSSCFFLCFWSVFEEDLQ